MRTHGREDVVREDLSLGKLGTDLARAGLSKRCTIAGNHDPLYLLACQVQWHHQRNLRAYQALVAALDDSDQRIRVLAEMLLHRSSPRPQRESRGVSRK
jgi:hypothetical protein